MERQFSEKCDVKPRFLYKNLRESYKFSHNKQIAFPKIKPVHPPLKKRQSCIGVVIKQVKRVKKRRKKNYFKTALKIAAYLSYHSSLLLRYKLQRIIIVEAWKINFVPALFIFSSFDSRQKLKSIFILMTHFVLPFAYTLIESKDERLTDDCKLIYREVIESFRFVFNDTDGWEQQGISQDKEIWAKWVAQNLTQSWYRFCRISVKLYKSWIRYNFRRLSLIKLKLKISDSLFSIYLQFQHSIVNFSLEFQLTRTQQSYNELETIKITLKISLRHQRRRKSFAISSPSSVIFWISVSLKKKL